MWRLRSSVSDLVSATKPCRIFMKFGFGTLYKKMFHMCQFRESQFNYCYTSPATEINFHSNFQYFIDQIWVKFDTENLHIMLLNICGCGNQNSESHNEYG
jgi:hypothetical protein